MHFTITPLDTSMPAIHTARWETPQWGQVIPKDRGLPTRNKNTQRIWKINTIMLIEISFCQIKQHRQSWGKPDHLTTLSYQIINQSGELTSIMYSTSRIMQFEMVWGAFKGIGSRISVCTSDVWALIGFPVNLARVLTTFVQFVL